MGTTETRQSILAATMRALSQFGIARLSLEDVAREAGLSRQTVHRYFGTKDELIRAAIVREEEAFVARVRAAVDGHHDVRPAVEAAFSTALRQAREHPLLDRLLATEPEALLPFLLTGRGPVLSVAEPVMRDVLSERLPHLSDDQLHRIADASARLVVSYAINPNGELVEQVASGLADLIVHGIKK